MNFTTFSYEHNLNLMANHPDGLDKHIIVQKNVLFLKSQTQDAYSFRELPYYFLYEDNFYSVLIGSDLVNDKIDIENKSTLTFNNIQKTLFDLSFYTDQIYKYLNIDKNKIQITLFSYDNYA